MYIGHSTGLYIEILPRGGGGKFGVWTKEGGGGGGAEAYVGCYTLHLLGGENDTREGKCPSPLKYSPVPVVYWCLEGLQFTTHVLSGIIISAFSALERAPVHHAQMYTQLTLVKRSTIAILLPTLNQLLLPNHINKIL